MAQFLTGDKKLERIFKTLPKKLQNKIIRDALKVPAKAIQQSAKALVPVDEGELKRAIRVRAMRRRRGFIGRSVIVDAKRVNRAGDESSGKRVAGAFQEYGFTTRSGEKVAADPFLVPAFKQHEPNIRTRVTAQIGRETIAAAKRA